MKVNLTKKLIKSTLNNCCFNCKKNLVPSRYFTWLVNGERVRGCKSCYKECADCSVVIGPNGESTSNHCDNCNLYVCSKHYGEEYCIECEDTE